MHLLNNKRILFVSLLATLSFSGCATLPGERDPRDPWESYNRSVYKFNDGADKAVLKPVAQAYRLVTPRFVRTGVTNFFNNLDDVTVFFNDLFQAKFGQAVADGGRFIINTTFGLGGVIDVAGAAGAPKHREDFGQTLGVWGMGPGPYFVLPLMGPSTTRDASGRVVDIFLTPSTYANKANVTTGANVLNVINLRSNLLDTEKVLDEAALDRYSFLRDAYLQRRESLVYDGNPPKKNSDEFFDDFDEPKKTKVPEKKK